LRDGRTVAEGAISEVTEQDLVQSMVGRQLGDYYPPRSDTPAAAEQPVLKIENLTRYDAGRKRFSDVSFELRRGEILGISGLVGAGRTELLETLFGAAGHHYTGHIQLDGREIRPGSPAEAIELGIGLVTEDRGGLGIFRQQSVLSNATMATLRQLTNFGLVSRSKERDALARQSEVMRIRRASDAIPIESLSGGNQQKVILARWLMTNPKVLLLDEPTRGIDVGAKAEIYKVLRSLADKGIGILFVSSELPEVLGLADRILVLSSGHLTANLPAAQATETTLLEAAMA
jgi:ABC-type sugar transport system ATPase subunit